MMPHHASLPTAARLQHRSPRPTPASHACLQDEGCPRARGLKKERSGGPRFEFFCLRVSLSWREECGGGKDLSHRPSADCSQARLDSTGTIPRCSSGVGSHVPSCGRGVRDGARQAGRGAGCGGCQRRSAAQRGVSGIRCGCPSRTNFCAVPAHCIPSVRSYPAVTSAVSEHLFRRLTALAPGALFLLAGIVRLLMDGTSVAGHAMNLFVLLLSALFWAQAAAFVASVGARDPSKQDDKVVRGPAALAVVTAAAAAALMRSFPPALSAFCQMLCGVGGSYSWTLQPRVFNFRCGRDHDAGDAAYFPRRRLPLPMARWRGPEQRACPWSFQT